MAFKRQTTPHRNGSNVLALALGAALIIFALWTLITGHIPLVGVPAYIVTGWSALIFGAVVLVWVASDWTKWIGNETINMVVGVIAALIAIVAFAIDIEKPRESPPGAETHSTIVK